MNYQNKLKYDLCGYDKNIHKVPSFIAEQINRQKKTYQSSNEFVNIERKLKILSIYSRYMYLQMKCIAYFSLMTNFVLVVVTCIAGFFSTLLITPTATV